MIREANKNDLDEILQLYLYLHEKSIPEDSEHLRSTWDNIMKDANHHLIVCETDGKIVASCVCVIIPNLTRNVRPYAFVENVVTHGEYRKKGYATDCLNFAKKIAEENNCYKMMLLTGSKEESTLNFYRNAGYNSSDSRISGMSEEMQTLMKSMGHLSDLWRKMQRLLRWSFCLGL